MPTPNISQLKRAVTIAEQIEKLQGDLALILGGSTTPASKASPADISATGGERRKHTMSAAGRARIVAAQKARWAKVKAVEGNSEAAPKKRKKRKLSPEARARISAAVKARWAREKA